MEKNKIYYGDCIELMKKLDSESVDLIIADPPYNLGKDFGNGSDKWEKVDDWIEWSKKWIKECYRVLKPTGSIFIYGIHKYLCYIQCYLYDLGMNYGRQFIWHYENNWSQYTKTPASNYEPILWFTKSKEYTYHQIREPYKSKERIKNKIIKNGKVWQPNPEGKHSGDVWKFPVLAGKLFEKERVNHPTQKPLSITNRIIRNFSNEENLILIPFVGSGTECVSAKINNRNFIGFEINKEYIKIANNRIENSFNLNLKV
jgi:DNA modification methylase